MRIVPLSAARIALSRLVDEVEATHEVVTITKHGRPVAVLLAPAHLESLHETVAWLSQRGIGHDVAAAERELVSRQSMSGEDLRAEFGLSKRPS